MKYAVMQPYFFPGESYFNLVADVDYFILFDNAQFPRRGRVHRCELLDRSGQRKWLTLPLEKAYQKAKISDLTLTADWQTEFTRRCKSFPTFERNYDLHFRENANYNRNLLAALRDWISLACRLKGINTEFLVASDIVPRDRFNDAQSYIIEIGRQMNCPTYLNASGGRDLYQAEVFAAAGLELEFQEQPTGSGLSVLASPEFGV